MAGMAVQVFKVRLEESSDGRRRLVICNKTKAFCIHTVPGGDDLLRMGIRTRRFFEGQIREDGTVCLLSETSWHSW